MAEKGARDGKGERRELKPGEEEDGRGKLGRARRCELGLAERRAVCHPAAPGVPQDPQGEGKQG